MKTNFFIPIVVVLVLGCTSDSTINSEIETIEPECLQSIIQGILEKEPTNPRANIKKYLYNDNEVFLIGIKPPEGSADLESAVLDVECELFCLLGGIDGKPSAECADFNETAQFIETTWTDPR